MAYKNIYTLFCKKLILKACSIYSSVVSHCSDPGMLGFVNWLLTIPRYNEHFCCLFENSLNRGVRYKEPSIQRTNFPNSLALR